MSLGQRTLSQSREPFVQSCVSHRLVREPYLSLLDEVNGVVTDTVQDAFRLTTNCQDVQHTDEDLSQTPVSLLQVPLTLRRCLLSWKPIALGGVSQLPYVNLSNCLKKILPSSFRRVSYTIFNNKML